MASWKTNEGPIKTRGDLMKRDEEGMKTGENPQNECKYVLFGKIHARSFIGSNPIAATSKETQELPGFLLFCVGAEIILRVLFSELLFRSCSAPFPQILVV